KLLRARITLPQAPANKEAASVPIFDIASRFSSANAKPATNNDIVKPIPQSQLAPKVCTQLTSGGALARPSLQESQAKVQIPIGLPINKPSATPSPTRCVRAANPLPQI